MPHAIIIDKDRENIFSITSIVNKIFPVVNFLGAVCKEEEYFTFLVDLRVEIVFIDPSLIPENRIQEIRNLGTNKVFICISRSESYAGVATLWQSVAYLLKPVKEQDLMIAVNSAILRVRREQEAIKRQKLLDFLLKDRNSCQLIGIPTVEGYQILHIKEIIRCEGLQKCTRIITTNKRKLVSSYNIGEFKRILEEHQNFFSPHRSHIINILFVKEFKKVGQIVMIDNSVVPIAKVKKSDFLNLITHL